MSLDAPVGKEGDATILDLMQDEATSHLAHDRINSFFRKEAIQKLMGRMNPREIEILKMRFGLKDGLIHTLDEAAKKFKITRERVRQIEEAALRKLRKYAEELKIQF